MKRTTGISLGLILLLAVSLVLTGSFFVNSVNAASPHQNVLIAFNNHPGASEQALVRSFGGKIKYTYTLVPAIAASIPEEAISGLEHNPRVLRVEPDVEIHAVGEIDAAWGVEHIGAGTVQTSGNTGEGVKVAIIDTGIDYNHPDLEANYAGGWDFVNNDPNPMDDNGHGTHVSGTIAAVKDGSGVVGVAPDAEIYALKVLNSRGSGSFSDVIAALQWCVGNGIQVTNNSYGSSRDPGQTVQDAFDAAYAKGVLNVAAAGNDGNASGRGDRVDYPGKYASVIAVAATDQNDKRASFSSTGPDVELAAPGVSILSTVPNDSYAYYSGTSMACPHVVGTAALVIASGVTGVQNIRKRLDDTADDLGVSGKDTLYGNGLVDADEAAGTAAPPTPGPGVPSVSISSPENGSAFTVGDNITFTGSANDLEDGILTSNLEWTSNLDGAIGTGTDFSKSLSEGQHTITASVTDSDGHTGSASVSITVAAPSAQPMTASVTDISLSGSGGKNKNLHLVTVITVKDDLGNPVSGASVSADLYLDGSFYLSQTGITDTQGQVSFRVNNAPSGTYTITVTSVNASGLDWDGITPPTDPFTK